MGHPERSSPVNRRRATLVVLPLLVVGLVNVAQLFVWGVSPLWAFVIVPPIAFFVVLGWLAFRTESAEGGPG